MFICPNAGIRKVDPRIIKAKNFVYMLIIRRIKVEKLL